MPKVIWARVTIFQIAIKNDFNWILTDYDFDKMVVGT